MEKYIPEIPPFQHTYVRNTSVLDVRLAHWSIKISTNITIIDKLIVESQYRGRMKQKTDTTKAVHTAIKLPEQ